MAKSKSYYYCSQCGYRSASWLGRCPECGTWNSMEEEVVRAASASAAASVRATGSTSVPHLLHEVTYSQQERIATHSAELDRVLGGGLVPGSLLLIGGEPGIGKSTLLLQTAMSIKDRTVFYVSGEESEQQIRMRAERVGLHSDRCYVLAETVTDRIFEHVNTVQPDILIIDSIQTMSTESIDSSAGSISQIRECTTEFQRYAKSSGVPVLLIGHITKDGSLAGPKVMEHIVDCVLQFEGDRNYGYRLLRTLKNRFGSTAEIGIFEMVGSGLREVANPSEFLLSHRDEQLSGTAVCATLEGARALLIEVQALVSSAVYGTPQRSANGFDFRRLSMLLAVLEKRCNFKLGAKDVFLNIAGGMRVSDPAIDLAVVCAILSSNVDIPISAQDCFAAEMGLTGEVRPVARLEQRIAEADRLGYERIFVSKYGLKGVDLKRFHIEVVALSVVEDAFRQLFA
ncbi:MAG: DNA repair protein RadA [Bacteroidales bacterium]|nr:DNA repair protein RadA [Bacteroidales bacterium]